MHRLLRRVAPVALAAALFGGLSACGGSDDDSGMHPQARGPVISGHATCAYVATPDECSDSGVPPAYWYLLPQDQPANYHENDTSDFLSQLFLWHLMYHSFYASPFYYDHYVPVSYRTTYVTRYVTTFDRTYSSQESRAAPRATYVSGNGKRRVSGDKLDPNKINPKRNTGGNGSGKTNCFAASTGDPVSGFAKPGGGSRVGGGSRGGSSSRRSGSSSRGSGRSGNGGGC